MLTRLYCYVRILIDHIPQSTRILLACFVASLLITLLLTGALKEALGSGTNSEGTYPWSAQT